MPYFIRNCSCTCDQFRLVFTRKKLRIDICKKYFKFCFTLIPYKNPLLRHCRKFLRSFIGSGGPTYLNDTIDDGEGLGGDVSLPEGTYPFLLVNDETSLKHPIVLRRMMPLRYRFHLKLKEHNTDDTFTKPRISSLVVARSQCIFSNL